nr:DUF1016 N-terminal domain-containing protein [Chryseobacterium glaciei]
MAESKNNVFKTTNTILLKMYWEIGRIIIEDEQNGEQRADYGKSILKNLANQLSLEFGKGFNERNLNNMRAFFNSFPIWNAVRTELSWTHYRIISRIDNPNQRIQYIEYSIEGNWNTRTLQRNIDSQYLGWDNSLRPKNGAPVSMPLKWEEVKSGLKPTDFNIYNSLDRLKDKGDLFKSVLVKGIDMLAAIKKLESQ